MLKRSLILSFLLVTSLSWGADPKNFRLYCRHTDGHFGYMNVTTDKDKEEVIIEAKQGYARELATQLGISTLPFDKMVLKVPLRDCNFDDKDPMLISFRSTSAKAHFTGVLDVEFEPREVEFAVTKLADTVTTKVVISHCTSSPARVELNYDSPLGVCSTTAPKD